MNDQLTIRNRTFFRNGRPHFLLCDTAWMAFLNLTVEEFREYAFFRAAQGYNGLLIQNTPAYQDMPKNIKYFPFYVNDDGSYDLGRWREEYFTMACRKMDIMREVGITPLIVPMWVSFIPDSQMGKVFDTRGKTFTQFEPYQRFIDRTIEVYKPYHPVWVLGGDAEMRAEDATNFQYYSYMARKLREECPGDLITAHTAGGQMLDERYVREGFVDFYLYQSGHMYDNFASLLSPAKLAGEYLQRDGKRPVMNGEPMYEAHGFGNKFGRFTEEYLRRAFWYSVLNGANCGFTYGAHGIWMFYDNSGFNNEAWSLVPMHWRSALNLPGSGDVAYCKDLFVRYGMFDVLPAHELNLTPYSEIMVGGNADRSTIVAYTPYMNYLYLAGDLRDYECRWHLLGREKAVRTAQISVTSGTELSEKLNDLCRGQVVKPRVSDELLNAPKVTVVQMLQDNCDALLVCRKRL